MAEISLSQQERKHLISSAALLCFLGASMALAVAAGPDNLFVLTQGISRGRKAAVVTAWGMWGQIHPGHAKWRAR